MENWLISIINADYLRVYTCTQANIIFILNKKTYLAVYVWTNYLVTYAAILVCKYHNIDVVIYFVFNIQLCVNQLCL